MTRTTFWSLVATLGWGTTTTDVAAIKGRLVREWPREQARAFHLVMSDVEGDLYTHLDTWADQEGEEFGCGDDSFGDLISHIVGLGEAEFDLVMANPKVALKRAQNRDFEEKFSYSIPDGGDYGRLTGDPYVKWAERNLKGLDGALAMPHIKGTLFKALQEIRAWNQIVADRDFTGALAGGPALVANLDRVEPLAKKVRGTWDELQAVRDALDLYWTNHNLLTDMQEIPPTA